MQDEILPDRAAAVLTFWFGAAHPPKDERARDIWFQSDAEFDAQIGDRFAADHATALAGEYADWGRAAASCLALVILLDQFSRNLFRGDARSFAADEMALTIAAGAIDAGLDKKLTPLRAAFLYLPFEHSERMEDQRRAVALYQALPPYPEQEQYIGAVLAHHDVIARFGRFPHRNKVLGRISTDEEHAFLAENPRGF